MSSDLKVRRAPKTAQSGARQRAPVRSAEATRQRAGQGPSIIKLRRRQAMAVGHDREGGYFIVRSGIVLVVAAVPDGEDVTSSILFPGDAYVIPRAENGVFLSLTAATPVELLRAQPGTADNDAPDTGITPAYLSDNLAHQLAGERLHMLALATLNGAQRFATLLFEFACRLGTEFEGNLVFDMPLTRVDQASYLGLNADTLSRIVSRFRETGILTRSGRSHFGCRDLALLRAETPFADAILARLRSAPVYPAR